MLNVIRTAKNLWIDISVQKAFLGGRVKSIDGTKIIYDSVGTPYNITRLIFFELYPIKETDILIDVGCGKGRVFNYLLYRGAKNKMIGYEINSTVANKTKRRLSKYKNVEIRCEDIFDNFPAEGNVFYLFNPFNHEMMVSFSNAILKMKSIKPVILYFNPTCIDIFNNENFTYELIDIPRHYYKFAIIRVT